MHAEPLEPRRMLAAVDPDDTIAEAHVIGEIRAPFVVADAISDPTDVDMFAFNAKAGQTLRFDIDTAENGYPGLGSYLRLFNGNGLQLRANNDAAAPDEPVVGFDSYLEYTFAAAGRYYVGVSNWLNTGYDPATGSGDYTGYAHLTGSYRLEISDPNYVPTISASLTRGTLKVYGSEGRDVIGVDTVNGRIRVGGKADGIVFSYPNSSVTRILVDAGGGNDRVTVETTLSLRTTLAGGAGHDVLLGGSGNDHLAGGSGNDKLVGRKGNDVLDGGSGIDLVEYSDRGRGEGVVASLDGLANDGGPGEVDFILHNVENLLGGGGDDVLYGNAGPNVIAGGRGADTISGGGGNDLLFAFLESRIDDGARDVINGGAGVDTVFADALDVLFNIP